MRLWIDGQCFQTASKRRGIGRYVQELLLGIIDNHPNVELLISLNAAMPIEALAARDHLEQWVKPANIFLWHGVADGGEAIHGFNAKRRLSEIALAHHVMCLTPDIALSASPFEGVGDKAVPLDPNDLTTIPVASLFYDAIPYRYPQHYLTSVPHRAYYERRLRLHSCYDLNLCISEYSRSECVEISKNPRALNILAGVSKDFNNAVETSDTQVPRLTEKPFILYVGALDWRKNVKSAIEAFARMPIDLRDKFSFVLAGDHPKSLLQAEEERWIGLGLPASDLVVVGHVTDRELVALYKQTELVIQPSLLEGFGLTALEAMTCGAPVIASNTGALPEVIGDPEFLFNPADVSDIERVMKKALTYPEAARRVAKRQQERAVQFSWARSASIAVDGLSDAVALFQLDETSISRPIGQQFALLAVEGITLPEDFIADTLARSETITSSGPRLIIDATSTYRIDHKTGIQRVVKSICASLPAPNCTTNDGVQRIVAYSDSRDGWFRIPNSLEKTSDASVFTDENRIEFSCEDRILMLDSSWEFHKHHSRTLSAARLRGASVVSCLYDTIPLNFPGFCSPVMPPIFSSWFKAALSYSTAFVCISKAVADELMAILEAIQFPRVMKIGYWHLGANFAEAQVPLTNRVERDPCQSFLMVGTIEPRKGHAIALDAFDELWSEGLDVKLTIVGRPGWGVEHLIRRIEDHAEYKKRLFWFNGISDQELQNAYAESDALVAASYAEGFGLPIVEAAHFGKPVIASDIPVFQEVSTNGPNRHLFTVGSSEALAVAVRKFLLTGAHAAKEQVEKTWISWKQSADDLQRVVINEDWYKIYTPRSDRTFVPINDIGMTAMTERLFPNETRYKIEFMEGPIVTEDRLSLRYIVRLTNLSQRLWSSVGAADDSLSVLAIYRILSGDGKPLATGNPRSPIPFVLPPKGSLCMAIDIPSEYRDKQGIFADIGLGQNAVGWWTDSLRVKL